MTEYREGRGVIIVCEAWVQPVEKFGHITKVTEEFVFVDSDDGELRSVCFTHDGQGVNWSGRIQAWKGS
ncbi:MAG TPA: hypothetical protein V6C57_23690 [Coleofasciculaceae cyanobacterium]